MEGTDAAGCGYLTAQVGLALYDGSQVIGEYAWRSSQRHTVELAPAISGLLTRCGLTMEAVSVLGVALGPGSFTSLRVGLIPDEGTGACAPPAAGRHLHAGCARRSPGAVPVAVGGCHSSGS